MTDESLWGFHIRKLLVKNAKKQQKGLILLVQSLIHFSSLGWVCFTLNPLEVKV